MQKPFWNKDLMAIFRAQPFRQPLPVACRTPAHVNHHVKHRATCAAHQFILRVGGRLIMQAPQRACRAGVGVIILHKVQLQPRSG